MVSEVGNERARKHAEDIAKGEIFLLQIGLVGVQRIEAPRTNLSERQIYRPSLLGSTPNCTNRSKRTKSTGWELKQREF